MVRRARRHRARERPLARPQCARQHARRPARQGAGDGARAVGPATRRPGQGARPHARAGRGGRGVDPRPERRGHRQREPRADEARARPAAADGAAAGARGARLRRDRDRRREGPAAARDRAARRHHDRGRDAARPARARRSARPRRDRGDGAVGLPRLPRAVAAADRPQAHLPPDPDPHAPARALLRDRARVHPESPVVGAARGARRVGARGGARGFLPAAAGHEPRRARGAHALVQQHDRAARRRACRGGGEPLAARERQRLPAEHPRQPLGRRAHVRRGLPAPGGQRRRGQDPRRGPRRLAPADRWPDRRRSTRSRERSAKDSRTRPRTRLGSGSSRSGCGA